MFSFMSTEHACGRFRLVFTNHISPLICRHRRFKEFILKGTAKLAEEVLAEVSLSHLCVCMYNLICMDAYSMLINNVGVDLNSLSRELFYFTH